MGSHGTCIVLSGNTDTENEVVIFHCIHKLIHTKPAVVQLTTFDGSIYTHSWVWKEKSFGNAGERVNGVILLKLFLVAQFQRRIWHSSILNSEFTGVAEAFFTKDILVKEDNIYIVKSFFAFILLI